MVTFFVVQSFQRGKKGMLIPDQPRQVRDQGQCVTTAARLSEHCAGVIGFSRTGDPATGDWDDAVVISQHGEMPAEMADMLH